MLLICSVDLGRILIKIYNVVCNEIFYLSVLVKAFADEKILY